MESYYPIMLKLAGKKIVVVGGGKVAERKIFGLIDTKANITVV
ncbi:MAG: NAD(P)-dependent oxidoreductase, partial [Bacillota bacterium]|nr:NAD(P)-dependent oxidoreductase [Bacillota bacterium]